MVLFPSHLIGTDLPGEIAALERRGEIGQALQLLESLKQGDGERERLLRLRHDFSVQRSEMLAKIRDFIPDASDADLDRWTCAGQIQALPIDGELLYFRREPVNLLRFSEDARERADRAKQCRAAGAGDPAGRSGTSFDLNEHIRECVNLSAEGNGPEILPQRFRVLHTIEVNADAVPAGEIVRCWLPYPQDYRWQKAGALISSNPEAAHISGGSTGGRCVYVEKRAVSGEATRFQVEFEYSSAAFAPEIWRGVESEDGSGDTSAGEDAAAFLSERLPHISFSPAVRNLARSITEPFSGAMKKAHAIFSWIQQNISYAAEMEYCLMPNITEKVLETRKGDCGVHAILFISLCRAAGIPARWRSGWVTRPNYWNLHDWAEFYAPELGWLPADPSLGWREDADWRVREFFFGHVDAFRMIANLDICCDLEPVKTFWRSDPVDFQRGEVEWRGGNLYYDKWSYKVEVSSALND